ncbi:PAS domain S-box protein, partial [bacterium]|nr:PAS domain S-box protein [bacterium]
RNYKTLAELSQNVILVHDGKNVLFANRKLYDLFAIPYDTQIDVPYLISLADLESREILTQMLERRLKGEPVSGEYEISGRNLNGERINLLVYATLITYNRKPAGLVNFVDITRFRQMERRLRFLNGLLKAISGVNQLIVREKDISKVLDGAAQLLKGVKNYEGVFCIADAGEGVIVPSEPEILQKLESVAEVDKWGEIIRRISCPSFIQDIDSVEDEIDEEILRCSRSMSARGLAMIPISYGDENYGLLCVLTREPNEWLDEEKNLLVEVAEDLGFAVHSYILEREKSVVLKKLAQSEYLYKTLIETAPLTITLHDGNRFIFVNREFLRMTGYESFEEVENIKVVDLLIPESREVAQEAINKMLASGEPFPPVEDEIICKDGTRCFVELAAAPVELDGKKYILIVAKDITQRRRAQQEAKSLQEKLLQAQKLEAIGRLAGGIAHEFNNLLNGIIGYAELLKENVSVASPAFRYAELILKTGLDAAKLTRQILSFSRKAPRENQPFSLNHAVNEVVEIIKQTAPRNVEIITDLFPKQVIVKGDMAQIEQVIMNLCVNGFDAMPDGGKLTLSTDIVEAGKGRYVELPAGKYARLTVEDTGIGMSEEIIKNIFDPFFTTKEPGEGTGLGLSIAYSIVHEHGGHIYVESEEGVGSRFEVLLPLAEGETAVAEGKPEHYGKTEGAETILVADDEPVLLNLLVDLLQSRGYRVLTAGNGAEAVELYKKRCDEIDLVLLDILMPKMDGLEALKEIKKIDPGAKILVISGYAQMDKIDSCLEAGALGFVKKPFRISELSEKIWAALHG